MLYPNCILSRCRHIRVNRHSRRVSKVRINSFRYRAMNKEKLLRRYAAGERDFSGIDLSGAILCKTKKT